MAKYLLVLALATLAYANAVQEPPQLRAITKLTSPGTNDVSGNVTFTQLPDGKIHITGTLFGLNAGKYGFHIHEKGDITGGCISAGSHFNPEHKNHGSPNDEDRHVGDLGNVEFKENKEAVLDITDGKIGFFGPNCIIGRSVVLHEKDDDFGKGGHPDSRKTGNAGGRVACGVIGILDPIYGWKTNDASQSTFLAAILIPMSTILLFIY